MDPSSDLGFPPPPDPAREPNRAEDAKELHLAEFQAGERDCSPFETELLNAIREYQIRNGKSYLVWEELVAIAAATNARRPSE